MKAHQLIEVLICCNEPESNHFSGYLFGFDVGALKMYCTLTEEGYWLLFEGNYLCVTNGKFYFADHNRKVDHSGCDQVSMPAESACSLINWARKNDFDWESGPKSFTQLLDEEQGIKIEHLDLLF